MGPVPVGRICGAALWGLCRGAAAALGSPRFPRAHAVGLAALVGLGPLLRLRAQPHSIFASPHNLLEARLISSAGGWTSLFLASLLVASFPVLRPPPAFLLRLIGRWLVGVSIWGCAPRLLSLVEGAVGRCIRPLPAGLLLLPHGGPAPCRAGGGQWEGPILSRQAFSLVYCALGLGEEAGLLGRVLYGDWTGGKGQGLRWGQWGGRGPGGPGSSGVLGGFWGDPVVREGPRSAPVDPGVWEGPRSAPRDPGVLGGFWRDPGIREGPRSAPIDPGVWEGPRSAPRDPGVLGRSQGFWGYPGVREGPRSSGGTQEFGVKLGFGGKRGIWETEAWEGPRSAPRDPGVREGPKSPGVWGGFWRDPGVWEGPRSTPSDPRVWEGPRSAPIDPGVWEAPRSSGGHPGVLGRFWRDPGVQEGPRRPGSALNLLFLLNVLLLVAWQVLLGVTLMYRYDWSSNAVGGAMGWAAWLVTYGGWFRWAWPGPTN